MVDAIVEVRGVSRSFGHVVALDQVDLEVGPGVIHGMLGPNGAGKTTLLAMLFGLVSPDAGSITVLGQRVGNGPRPAGLTGFIEAPQFYPYLSARKNLEVLARLDGAADDRMIAAVLARTGLESVGDQRVRGFSLGMRQRLGLAASLLRPTDLLVLDEPANGLDPAAVRDLRRVLRELADDGSTILLSSHNMPEVEQLCDHVTVMTSGRVVFEGSLDAMRLRAPAPAVRLETSDDQAALSLAANHLDLTATDSDHGGLLVRAAQPTLDAFVLRLGRSGVAVRLLTLDTTSLESLFFLLTEPGDSGDPPDMAERSDRIARSGSRVSGSRV